MSEYVVVLKDGVTVFAVVVNDSDAIPASEDEIIRRAVEDCGLTNSAVCWISSLSAMRKRRVIVTREVRVQK